MNCPKCNANLKEGAAFCHVCGFKIVDSEQHVPPADEPKTETNLGDDEKVDANTFTDVKSDEVIASVKSGNMFRRIFAILFAPRKEWGKISKEKPKVGMIIFGYLLILAIVALSAVFIGDLLRSWRFNFFAATGIFYLLFYNVLKFVSLILTPVIAALILNAIAPSLKIKKNFGRMMQLTGYSFTPVLIAWTLYLIPTFQIFHLVQFVGLYGAFIFLMGYKKLFEIPADKQLAFYFTGIGILYGVYYVLHWTVYFIQTPSYGSGVIHFLPL